MSDSHGSGKVAVQTRDNGFSFAPKKAFQTYNFDLIDSYSYQLPQSQEAFHPHVAGLAPIMHRYLKGNEATQHLDIDLEEFAGVLKTLDLAILNVRLNDDPDWGTPYFYKKLHKMLKGYLLSNT